MNHKVQCEINEINEWLSNRPSATMDPCLDERKRKMRRLTELKARRRGRRAPVNMMQAQNESYTLDEDKLL